MAADLVLPEPHLSPLLKKASIKVVDAPELSAEPAGYGRFQTGTKLTERSTLAQLYAAAGPVTFTILGGLSVLPPATPIDQQVVHVDDEQRKMGASFGRLEKATFDLIKKAIGDGIYRDFLFFELVTKARDLKSQAVGQRQIAEDLVALGLAEDEAELVSAAVIQDDAATAAGPDIDLAAELQEMLQEGRLRQAQRHLTADHGVLPRPACAQEAEPLVSVRLRRQTAHPYCRNARDSRLGPALGQWLHFRESGCPCGCNL
jgi:hypothetical protein